MRCPDCSDTSGVDPEDCAACAGTGEAQCQLACGRAAELEKEDVLLCARCARWSPFQLDIFGDVAGGEGDTIVEAVAGSGKTTVLVEAVTYVPEGCSTLFVAFNKAIADELGQRLMGLPVTVSTLHSYGLKTVTAGLGRLRINRFRVPDMLREKLGDGRETMTLRRGLEKTVSLAKSALAFRPEEIDAIIDGYEIEVPPGFGREEFVAIAADTLTRCQDTSDGCLDFDDMVWLPIVLGLSARQYDRVFVDEAQDLSVSQIEMVLRAVKPDGRILAARDEMQRIYQFRGADAQAFARMTDRFKAKSLPLSISYRCSRAVVAHVRTHLPNIPIQSAPDAPAGEVAYVSRERMVDARTGAQPGDFILSRTNAPLIGLCMKFLRAGRRANIQGRDVGDSLTVFVKKSGAEDVAVLRTHVESWSKKECARLSAKHRDTQAVEDRTACLLELSDGAPDIATVLDRIDELFADRAGEDCIVLSSTHKAKGLERDRVWMLVGTYMRKPGVESDNIFYVACTRAKTTLFLVEGYEKKRRGADGEGATRPSAVIDASLEEMFS